MWWQRDGKTLVVAGLAVAWGAGLVGAGLISPWAIFGLGVILAALGGVLDSQVMRRV